MGDVGTTKLFEDERIILWEFVLEPGGRTACHTHDKAYMFYVLEGSRLEVFDAGAPRSAPSRHEPPTYSPSSVKVTSSCPTMTRGCVRRRRTSHATPVATVTVRF